MSYVDGFVIPVPRRKIGVYRKMAREGLKMWMKHGALDYKECVAQDPRNCMGPTFAKMMKLKPGETVFFSYIVFKSRAHRDAVNKKVIKTFEAMGSPPDMPFDVKRMVYGGFKTLVE